MQPEPQPSGPRAGRAVAALSVRAGDALTPRELQILKLMCEGLSNPEILDRCRIGATTLKSHQKSLYQKFGVSNRSQVIVRALRTQIVRPGWLDTRSAARLPN